MKKIILVICSILLLNVLVTAQTKWNLDKAHATIGFAIDHMVVSEIQGKFTDFDIMLEADKADFTDAKFSASIKVSSVNTENKMRDEHLVGADFFDVTSFPTINFSGLKIEKNKANKYKASGELTIKGVTKKVSFDVKVGGIVKDPWGKTRTGFKITGTLNREDFGLKYNSVLEAGGLTIGKEVRINIAVEFVK